MKHSSRKINLKLVEHLKKDHIEEEYDVDWIDYSQIKPKQQEWFWPGVIPLNNVTLFAGDGGVGKSTMLLDLIAKTTTGEEFNCCGTPVKLPKGQVILMSAEDEGDTQITPKLEAAGIDYANLRGLKVKQSTQSGKKKFLELDKELDVLEAKIAEFKNVKLIVIDPVSYFIGDVQDHVQKEVANFINALIELARKYSLSIILNKHLRKSKNGLSPGKLAHEVGGSGAWINSPRMAWGFVEHPETPKIKLMFNIKSNITERKASALNYQIKPYTLECGIETVKIEWGEKCLDISEDEAVSKEAMGKSQHQKALHAIEKILQRGGTYRSDIVKELATLGINEDAFKTAVRDLIKQCIVVRDSHSRRAFFELHKNERM